MSELRQAVRSLFRRPIFAFTALLTIALGIGANTAVYAIVHAVLLEPLPFRQPAELVQVWETHPELHNLQVSVPDYLDWRRSVKSLDLAAYTFQSMDKATLLGQGAPTTVQGTNASSDLFPLLGTEPILGHIYNAQEEKQPVILISEQLWHRKFSADSHVIGRSLRLGRTSYTIIGVLPQKTAFPIWADVWMPLSLIEPELYSTRKYHPLEVIGRLKPWNSVRQAEKETETTARRLSAAYPATNGKIGAFVTPLMESMIGEVRPALVAAWVAVGLVLLIACANLAHLMMARALNRQHEIALRLALGANRLWVLRTFFLETFVLSFTGGLLGILAAGLALPIIQRLADGQLPRSASIAINSYVLLFGLCASLVVAALFVAPSYLQIFHSDLNNIISSGNTRGSSVRRSWLSPVLMGSEVAFSLAVLLAAIVLLRSFSLTLNTEPGFQRKNALVVRSPLIEGDWQKSYNFLRNRVVPELASIPGVRAVAAVNAIPMSLGTTEHSRYATRFGIAGVSFVAGQFPTAQTRWCTPNYFQVLGIPLIRGRLLTDADHNQPRYLINAAFARRFFPNSDPVGQKLLLGVVTPHPESDEIVGVVGDVREFGLTSAAEPTMYSVDVSPEMDIVLKTAAQSTTLDNSVLTAMRRINPQEASGPIKTMSSYIAVSLSRQRFILALIATFAGIAVILCAVGIYGVFSYSVTRRLREFGIRSAVGARKQDIIVQVIRESLAVILPGLAVGTGISAACSQFMRALLYRVSPTDTASIALATISVLALCLGSVIIPSLRAAQVDPARMFREQ
jgi:predicted permease